MWFWRLTSHLVRTGQGHALPFDVYGQFSLGDSKRVSLQSEKPLSASCWITLGNACATLLCYACNCGMVAEVVFLEGWRVSKTDKLLGKLRSKPAPTDFRRSDLVTLMKKYEFEVSCDKGGSHYSFWHKESDHSLTISRSHPDGILKKYQVVAALNALDHIGIISHER